MTHVPDTASVIKIGADGKHIDESGIKWIVSPYDEYALEEALQLTESKGGEVTVVTYGPQRAEQGLRECLARGAHNAVHIEGGEATLGDSLAIAKVLAAAVKDREYDVILVGVKGVGTDNAQVGPMLAELLDLPHITSVVKIEWGEGSIVAEREVVPELLQREATGERIAAKALDLIRSGGLERIERELAEVVRPRLGEPGAADRAADHILALLHHRANP